MIHVVLVGLKVVLVGVLVHVVLVGAGLVAVELVGSREKTVGRVVVEVLRAGNGLGFGRVKQINNFKNGLDFGKRRRIRFGL